jgi:hypothetical protein
LFGSDVGLIKARVFDSVDFAINHVCHVFGATLDMLCICAEKK